ncbi:hypothetical protein RchiOBHm_Chr3g0450321 [Rosa chinensis]|uniref:Uncharacterized protein n=1 Tax=Rosa chinensis TaxID=74649 RepID=A0A2P6R5Q9_ROSCH|nr:hypothetical protein RchiOBHm_Chr3g0450321 [Rosa chinensis]
MLLKEMGYNDNQPDALSYSVGYISSGHFNPAITIDFPCTAFDRKFLNRGLRGTVKERLRAILRRYRGGFEFKKEGSQQRKAAHKCVLFLKGIVLTLPAMATTMPNLTPGSICVIACTVRDL